MAIEDKKERALVKQKTAPLVTISGTFKSRRDEDLIQHSGYIAVDIDDVDPVTTKRLLADDPYIVAMFQSISGRGLCIIFQIVPSKHREAFLGICEYLLRCYRLIADPTSVNPSRARFVSFDPDIYRAEEWEKFTDYPKEKEPRRIDPVIFSGDDFDEMMNQISARNINMCENYYEWLRIAFAFASHFGESGRNYFHHVSQYSSKYNMGICDKQYDACLKREGSGQRRSTIATFYYYCKQHGIKVYSERTKMIAHTTIQGKRAGLSGDQIAENLRKFEGIDNAEEVISQAFAMEDFKEDAGGVVREMEIWLSHNYSLRRNEITRYVENNGQSVEQRHLNSIFIAGYKINTDFSYQLLERLILSDFVPTYNPLITFIEENKYRKPSGLIRKMAETIQGTDVEYVNHFLTRWLCGIIASIYGGHNPLMFTLLGEKQNTGKTEWFRRLLPQALQSYYAESKLEEGKDDDILMTQKLIIMDDEMSGKAKREAAKFKYRASKQVFSLREPYGRGNVDLRRLASMCATSNPLGVIDDPTGNRRVVPVHVTGVNHELYNSIDKSDLFMEAYHLWASGFEWRLKAKDIEYLNNDKLTFEVVSEAKELILKYFSPVERGDQFEERWTTTEIRVYMGQRTGIHTLNVNRIGMEMKSLGFQQIKSSDGKRREWLLRQNPEGKPPVEDAPF